MTQFPDPSRVAVLVAGGFHTAMLTQMLREKNVSYVVISPTVEHLTESDHDLYVKRLNGNWLTIKEVSVHFENKRDVFSKIARFNHAADKSLTPGLYGKILAGVSFAVLYSVWAHGMGQPSDFSNLADFVKHFSPWAHTAAVVEAMGAIGLSVVASSPVIRKAMLQPRILAHAAMAGFLVLLAGSSPVPAAAQETSKISPTLSSARALTQRLMNTSRFTQKELDEYDFQPDMHQWFKLNGFTAKRILSGANTNEDKELVARAIADLQTWAPDWLKNQNVRIIVSDYLPPVAMAIIYKDSRPGYIFLQRDNMIHNGLPPFTQIRGSLVHEAGHHNHAAQGMTDLARDEGLCLLENVRVYEKDGWQQAANSTHWFAIQMLRGIAPNEPMAEENRLKIFGAYKAAQDLLTSQLNISADQLAYRSSDYLPEKGYLIRFKINGLVYEVETGLLGENPRLINGAASVPPLKILGAMHHDKAALADLRAQVEAEQIDVEAKTNTAREAMSEEDHAAIERAVEKLPISSAEKEKLRRRIVLTDHETLGLHDFHKLGGLLIQGEDEIHILIDRDRILKEADGKEEIPSSVLGDLYHEHVEVGLQEAGFPEDQAHARAMMSRAWFLKDFKALAVEFKNYVLLLVPHTLDDLWSLFIRNDFLPRPGESKFIGRILLASAIPASYAAGPYAMMLMFPLAIFYTWKGTENRQVYIPIGAMWAAIGLALNANPNIVTDLLSLIHLGGLNPAISWIVNHVFASVGQYLLLLLVTRHWVPFAHLKEAQATYAKENPYAAKVRGAMQSPSGPETNDSPASNHQTQRLSKARENLIEAMKTDDRWLVEVNSFRSRIAQEMKIESVPLTLERVIQILSETGIQASDSFRFRAKAQSNDGNHEVQMNASYAGSLSDRSLQWVLMHEYSHILFGADLTNVSQWIRGKELAAAMKEFDSSLTMFFDQGALNGRLFRFLKTKFIGKQDHILALEISERFQAVERKADQVGLLLTPGDAGSLAHIDEAFSKPVPLSVKEDVYADYYPDMRQFLNEIGVITHPPGNERGRMEPPGGWHVWTMRYLRLSDGSLMDLSENGVNGDGYPRLPLGFSLPMSKVVPPVAPQQGSYPTAPPENVLDHGPYSHVEPGPYFLLHEGTHRFAALMHIVESKHLGAKIKMTDRVGQSGETIQELYDLYKKGHILTTNLFFELGRAEKLVPLIREHGYLIDLPAAQNLGLKNRDEILVSKPFDIGKINLVPAQNRWLPINALKGFDDFVLRSQPNKIVALSVTGQESMSMESDHSLSWHRPFISQNEVPSPYDSVLREMPDWVQPLSEHPIHFGKEFPDRFTPIGYIGTGGYSEVILAVDKNAQNKKVVIKIPKLDRRDSGIGHLIQEASAMKRIGKGPGIIEGAELLQQGEYYVEDFLDGPNLDAVIEMWRQNSTPFQDRLPVILRMADDVLETLAFLHRKSFLHNDVKPGNIVMTQKRAYLKDFALAGVMRFYVPGTPFFTPESLMNSTETISLSRDVFALGITIRHALILTPYQEGIRIGFQPHIDAPASEMAEIRRIISKATAPNAADRYSSAEEMRRDILAMESSLKPVSDNQSPDSDSLRQTPRPLKDSSLSVSEAMSLSSEDMASATRRAERIFEAVRAALLQNIELTSAQQQRIKKATLELGQNRSTGHIEDLQVTFDVRLTAMVSEPLLAYAFGYALAHLMNREKFSSKAAQLHGQIYTHGFRTDDETFSDQVGIWVLRYLYSDTEVRELESFPNVWASFLSALPPIRQSESQRLAEQFMRQRARFQIQLPDVHMPTRDRIPFLQSLFSIPLEDVLKKCGLVLQPGKTESDSTGATLGSWGGVLTLGYVMFTTFGMAATIIAFGLCLTPAAVMTIAKPIRENRNRHRNVTKSGLSISAISAADRNAGANPAIIDGAVLDGEVNALMPVKDVSRPWLEWLSFRKNLDQTRALLLQNAPSVLTSA